VCHRATHEETEMFYATLISYPLAGIVFAALARYSNDNRLVRRQEVRMGTIPAIVLPNP
jgi:hypothetical protein